jgi:uncharacterized protein (TIGR02646 family)
MIKLDLLPKPEQLTDELVRTKTLEFKADTTKNVWNIPWLKNAIAGLAYGKCCYSEIRLGEESNYMEVEHFFPKKLYPDKVMQWGNLLPSCKKCNTTKGNHDTRNEPIVNPFIDNPKDYFYIDGGFYRVKDASLKGKRTLDKLGLNDISHFVKPRRIVSEIITRDLSVYKVGTVLAKNDALSKCLTGLKGLMGKGNRKEKYAALYSTIILEDDNFKAIETYLKENNLWDEELNSLKQELEFCALPTPKIIHNL